ncbi:MAG: DUF1127 domain-containing protein [Rhodobacteraceae bacterium]|nr:DUF1127 domain-containing protein [Paracoccaceae bacterium]
MAYVYLPRPNAPASLYTRFTQAVDSMKQAQRQRRMYRKTINELNSLSDRELNDLGLCRSMISDVARTSVYR